MIHGNRLLIAQALRKYAGSADQIAERVVQATGIQLHRRNLRDELREMEHDGLLKHFDGERPTDPLQRPEMFYLLTEEGALRERQSTGRKHLQLGENDPKPMPEALVVHALVLLERQVQHLRSSLGFNHDAHSRRLCEAIDNPRPGDWLVVGMTLFKPIQVRVGRLIRVTGEGEYDKKWLIETISGQLFEWHNCRVMRLVTASPYEHNFTFVDDPPDEDQRRWLDSAKARWRIT